jgi:hypothetical protein
MTGRRTEILLLQAPLYWDIYVPLDLDSARLAFTCHNFEYRGSEPAGALTSCGLNVQSLLRPDLMQDNSSPKKISILKVASCNLIIIFFGASCMLDLLFGL